MGVDPSGNWTYIGVMSAVTIGTVITSISIPFVGAAYLAARGKLSPVKVLNHLMEADTWLSASFGLLVGTGASIAIQGGVMKLGQAVAKKVTPGLGLFFAGVGLVESIRMTYRLVTEDLPAEDAEKYVANMLAGSMLSALLGLKMRQWAKTAKGDTSYWQMSAQDQAAYNRGQSLLPSSVHSKIASLSPVAKGQYLEQNFSSARLQLLKLQGLYESIINIGKPGQFSTFNWIGTGLTPELRGILGTNGASVLGTIAAILQIESNVQVD